MKRLAVKETFIQKDGESVEDFCRRLPIIPWVEGMPLEEWAKIKNKNYGLVVEVNNEHKLGNIELDTH